jgi:hypothetical protein
MPNVGSLTVTGVTDGSSVNELDKTSLSLSIAVKDVNNAAVNPDAVEAYLLVNGTSMGSYTPQNTGSTGAYAITIPASDVLPGQNQVLVRAFTQVNPGTDNRAKAQATGKSGTLTVKPAGNVEDTGETVWKRLNLTGKQIKAAAGANTGASKTVSLATLPSGVLLQGCVVKVLTADAGTATTTTFTLGTNSTSFDNLLSATDMRTAQEVDQAAAFVPKLAGGTSLSTVIAVTGSGKTIADIQDAAEIDIYYGYVKPSF